MITCSLVGGLGNMMFGIAASYALAWRNGDTTSYCLSDHIGRPHKEPKFYKNNILRNLPLVEDPINIQEYSYSPIKYEEIPYYNPLKLTGYFQNELYFKDFESQIKQLFSIEDSCIHYINNKYGDILGKGSMSIHIRRGDYLMLPEHPVCNLDYYSEAMGVVQKQDRISNILIFSDDIEWCKANITDFQDKITYVEDEEDYIELWMMSLCNHNIIANSTFSWWGAWLNNHSDKIVVGPKKWFGPGLQHEDTSDILPKTWIKI